MSGFPPWTLTTPETYSTVTGTIGAAWSGLSPPSGSAPATATVESTVRPHTAVIAIRNWNWQSGAAAPALVVPSGTQGFSELRVEGSMDNAVNYLPVDAIRESDKRERRVIYVPTHPDTAGGPYSATDWFNEKLWVPGADIYTHLRVRCRSFVTGVWVDIAGTAAEGPSPVGPPMRDTLILSCVNVTPGASGTFALLDLKEQRTTGGHTASAGVFAIGPRADVTSDSYAVPLRSTLYVHSIDVSYRQNPAANRGGVEIAFKARLDALVTSGAGTSVYNTAMAEPGHGTPSSPNMGYATKTIQFDPPLRFPAKTNLGFTAMTLTGDTPGRLWITAHCTEGP